MSFLFQVLRFVVRVLKEPRYLFTRRFFPTMPRAKMKMCVPDDPDELVLSFAWLMVFFKYFFRWKFKSTIAKIKKIPQTQKSTLWTRQIFKAYSRAIIDIGHTIVIKPILVWKIEYWWCWKLFLLSFFSWYFIPDTVPVMPTKQV